MSQRPNARMWNGDDRFDLREKSDRHGEFEAMTELTCGPQDQSKSNTLNSSAEDKQMRFSTRRDQCNLEDFQTEYGNAKFFVIKSYSEDDIHKCIKYDVWSSTSNGNKKLDAAFHNTDGKTSEVGTECPIFLLYSVNGSGQSVGLAEMVAPVDFAKNMDFWQHDKWNGFFPVKWHIIKDIPNSQLRHIILENNENKPVTHSRDTQEGNELCIKPSEFYLYDQEELCFYDIMIRGHQRDETVIGFRLATAEPAIINPVRKSEPRKWYIDDVFAVISLGEF